MKASTSFHYEIVPAVEGSAKPELLLLRMEWKGHPFGSVVQGPGHYFSLALISEESELSRAKPKPIVTE